MPTLVKELRRELAKTITKARDAAEKGARKALEALAVDRPDAFGFMDDGQKALRKHLRAHGRQLGDTIDAKKMQTVDHLALECAYEQWHRMLFARFLAENDLLIEPQANVAIALDECRELALERGVDWLELASEFAVRMLPQIFRADDPVLAVMLPKESRQELERLLESLPHEVFTADDSLGWVYQFWQADKKDSVNASEAKIKADDLPAVTQLFTEDYMVLFLLHNTIGAWWAGKVLERSPDLAAVAATEDELRTACRVGDVEWTYLRFVKNDDGRWRPTAGTFDAWPRTAREITMLDPCMGSGHFLVFALPMLAAIRAAEESLSRTDAFLTVLRDNLHGLELDPRCTQIAAFNLALATWKQTGHRPLPMLHLACSGLPIAARESEWIDLAGSNSGMRETMAQLYGLFKQAPVLGSLIDPKRLGGDLFTATFEAARPALEKALAFKRSDIDENELAIYARGLLEAAELLTSTFTLVATNVPYLGRGKQDQPLKEYCERYHASGKADLSTCFVERCLTFCKPGGSAALVTPQNWLFQSTYERLRRDLLTSASWLACAKLGSNAFEGMNWWAAVTLLSILGRSRPDHQQQIHGLDTGATKDRSDKSESLKKGPVLRASQRAQLKNDKAVITFEEDSSNVLLRTVAPSTEGLSTGDGDRYIRRFFELPRGGRGWEFFQVTPGDTSTAGGMSHVILWEDGRGSLASSGAARIQGQSCWGRRGVLVSRMNRLKCSLYLGTMFDKMSVVLAPKDVANLPAVWAFCISDDYYRAVRALSQNVAVATSTLASVPFDLSRWRDVASQAFPSSGPELVSNDPAQWVFTGRVADTQFPLLVGVGRLLGYGWPRQTGSGFQGCPDVGQDGLEPHFDEDGIVAIPALRGERSAADRLHALLATAFGADWSVDRLATLLSEAGFGGRSLDVWLREAFFEQHCALFDQTPFLWHLWDGTKDGFQAIVNYHRLAAPGGEGRRTLEKVIYTYLREWIEQQHRAVQSGAEGAEGRLAAAEHLRDELLRIVDGDPPYDLFVRWKPLHEQAIGWEPDINDGVRVNIRPFMAARALNGKPILRVAPKIKWNKDRGNEPVRPIEEYPWLWGSAGSAVDFEGDPTIKPEEYGKRWNDLHYSRRFKQAARERHRARRAKVTK